MINRVVNASEYAVRGDQPVPLFCIFSRVKDYSLEALPGFKTNVKCPSALVHIHL